MSLLKTKIKKEIKLTESESAINEFTNSCIEFTKNNFKKILGERYIFENGIKKKRLDLENGSYSLLYAKNNILVSEFYIFWGKERNPQSNKKK